MRDLPLSPALFAIFASLVEEDAGLSYGVSDRDLLAAKISARATDLGFESAFDYYQYLRYDDDARGEREQLIEDLLVHETFFFREMEPLTVLVDDLIAPAVDKARARGDGPLLLWSAACSTGEEPLTLAMMLAARDLLPHVHIVASDVSRAALERARTGLYSRRAVRCDELPACAHPWLVRVDDGWRCDQRLVDAIEWRRINLIRAPDLAWVPSADFIVCRNLLFYFSDDVARRVVDHVAARMKPDGALVVGVAESLLRIGTSLTCEERRGAFIYRKTAAPMPPPGLP